MTDTVITSNSKASDKDVSGLELGTYRTATVAIDSDYFCASGITFENTVVSAPGDKGRQAQCVITSTAETFGAIAAHHRSSPDDDTGFSFVRCVINGSGRVLLGRAWGTYSRTIYSYCYIEDMISPLGWSDWSDPSRQRTAVFGQYRCRGSGANTKGWVPWARTFTSEEVRPYVDRNFINGEQWLNL
ncbi:Pectinesterase QRT1 [Cucurbita argyrosperma subsp. argyrosperma]|nr:Pectinesterase QRT1 [Cucurbita argyrosperma subsp. argyrosperma]